MPNPRGAATRPKMQQTAQPNRDQQKATVRSFYVKQKWTKHPPAANGPPAAPRPPAKDFRRRRSNLTASEHGIQTLPEMDFATVYNNCFKPWKVEKRQPFKLEDCLKASEGFGSQDRKQSTAAPFESITSYRADYTAKTPQGEGCFPNQQSRPAVRACVFGEKAACDISRELLNGASEFLNQFNNWTLETKFQGQVRGPSADHKIQSTARMIQDAKPTSPPLQTRDKSKKTLQGVTLKATSPQSKMTKTTEAPQFPAENTVFTSCECSVGNEEARMCWSSCMDRGVTEGGGCVEPSQAQQIA